MDILQNFVLNVDKLFKEKEQVSPFDIIQTTINTLGNNDDNIKKFRKKKHKNVENDSNKNEKKAIDDLISQVSGIFNSKETSDNMNMVNEIGNTLVDNIKETNKNVNIEGDDKLTGNYDDIDLNQLSQVIINKLEEQFINEVQLIKDQIEKEKEKLKENLTICQKNECINKINLLIDKRNENEGNKKLIQYLDEIRSCLSAYQNITPNKKSFIVDNSVKNNEEDKVRLLIISHFLEISKKYIPIDIILDNKKDFFCVGCGYSLTEIDRKCPNCDIETNVYHDYDNYQSISPINNYNSRDNFIRIMYKKQGQISSDLPYNWIEMIDDYFEKYHPDLIKCKNVPKNRTNRDIMYRCLKEIGYNEFYEDIDGICHIYWGWELLNFSHLEDKIIEDYDLSQKIFEMIKEERTSSLNAQYRIYRHLEKLGFECNPEDFKLMRTEVTLEYYERIWAEICRQLNWPVPKHIIY